MNSKIFNFLILLIFLFGFQVLEGKSQDLKLFVLPFENFSSNPQAFERIYPLLIKELSERGFDFYEEEYVKGVMKEIGIKERGFVLKDHMDQLYKNYGIQYLLTGGILNFSEDTYPRVSLHVRIVKLPEKKIIWSGYYGKTGEEYEGFFGLGKVRDIDELSRRVLKGLFSELHIKTLISKIEARPKKRMVLLPFRNLSQEAWVGKMATYILLTELTKLEEIEVSEMGEAIDFMIKYTVLPLAEMTYADLESAALEMEVDYVILGTVDDFWEEGVKTYYPLVVLALRILNTKERKVLYADDCYFTGISKEGILESGRIRLGANVAYECAKKLVKKIKNLEKGP